MAWFRVDDQFGTNPKVMQIPRAERHACLGLWLQAGVWAAQHLTDGRIPSYMLEELGANVSQRDRLLEVGLWHADGDDVVFNDWADYQPSRADVMAMREKERRRKEAYRLKKAGITGQSPTGTEPDGDAGHQRVSGHPDPTRPDPTRPTKEVPKGTSSSSNSVMQSRPEIDALMDLLDSELAKNNTKLPSRTKQNVDAARLLIDRDGYTVAQVEYLIRWCQSDEFWRANIRSMSKLREKADTLRLQSQRQTAQAGTQTTKSEKAHDFINELTGGGYGREHEAVGGDRRSIGAHLELRQSEA